MWDLLASWKRVHGRAGIMTLQPQSRARARAMLKTDSVEAECNLSKLSKPNSGCKTPFPCQLHRRSVMALMTRALLYRHSLLLRACSRRAPRESVMLEEKHCVGSLAARRWIANSVASTTSREEGVVLLRERRSMITGQKKKSLCSSCRNGPR